MHLILNINFINLLIFFSLNLLNTANAIKCGAKCKSCAMSCQIRLTSFKNKQSCILSCSPEFRDQKVSFVDPYWNCIHTDCLKSGTGLPNTIKSDDDWNKWHCPRTCLTKNNNNDHLVNLNDIQLDAECDEMCRMCRFTCHVSATRYAKDVAHNTSNALLEDSDMKKIIVSLRERAIECISLCEKCQTPCLKLQDESNQKRCWRSCCPSFSRSQTVNFYGPYYDCMSEQCFVSDQNAIDLRIMPARITNDDQFTSWECQQRCAKIENVWKNEIILESKVHCNDKCAKCQNLCDYLEFPYHRYTCKEACSELFSAKNKSPKKFTSNSGYYQCLHDNCFEDAVAMSEILRPTNDISLSTNGLDMNFYGWKCRQNCWNQNPTTWRGYVNRIDSTQQQPEQNWKTIDDIWPSLLNTQPELGVIDALKLTKAQELSRCQCIETELKLIKGQKFAKDLFDELEAAVNPKKQKKIKPKKGLVKKSKEKHKLSRGTKLGKEIDEEIDSLNEKPTEEPADNNSERDGTQSQSSPIYTDLTATTESLVAPNETEVTTESVSSTVSVASTVEVTTEININEKTTTIVTRSSSSSSGTTTTKTNTEIVWHSSSSTSADDSLENRDTDAVTNTTANTNGITIDTTIDTTIGSTGFETTTESSLNDIKENADTIDEQIDDNSNANTDEILKSIGNGTNSTEESDQDSESIKSIVDSVEEYGDEDMVPPGGGSDKSIAKTMKPMTRIKKRRRMRKNLTNKLGVKGGKRRRRKKLKPIVKQLKPMSNKTDNYTKIVMKDVLTYVNLTATTTTTTASTTTANEEVSGNTGTVVTSDSSDNKGKATTDNDLVNSTTKNDEIVGQISETTGIANSSAINEIKEPTVDNTADTTLMSVLNETELSVATISDTSHTNTPIDEEISTETPIASLDAKIKDRADSVTESEDVDVDNATIVNYNTDKNDFTTEISVTVTTSSVHATTGRLTTVESSEQITNKNESIDQTSDSDLDNVTDAGIVNTVRVLSSSITSVSPELVEDKADIVTESESNSTETINENLFASKQTTTTSSISKSIRSLTSKPKNNKTELKAYKKEANKTQKLLSTADTLPISSNAIESTTELFDSTHVSISATSPQSVEDNSDILTESENNSTPTIHKSLWSSKQRTTTTTTSSALSSKYITKKNKTEFKANKKTKNETEKLSDSVTEALNSNTTDATTELNSSAHINVTSIEDNANILTEITGFDSNVDANYSNNAVTQQMPESTADVATNAYKRIASVADIVTENYAADTTPLLSASDNGLDGNEVNTGFNVNTDNAVGKSVANSAATEYYLPIQSDFWQTNIYNTELPANEAGNQFDSSTPNQLYGASVAPNDIYNVTVLQEMMQKNSSSIDGNGGDDAIAKESDHPIANVDTFDTKTTIISLIDETYSTIGGEEPIITTEFVLNPTEKIINAEIDGREPSVDISGIDVKNNPQKDDTEKPNNDVKSMNDNVDDDGNDLLKYRVGNVAVKADLRKKKLSIGIQKDNRLPIDDISKFSEQKDNKEDDTEKQNSDKSSSNDNAFDDRNDMLKYKVGNNVAVKADLRKKKLSAAVQRDNRVPVDDISSNI